MAKTPIDPFTLEIIKEGLQAIGDEMFVTTQRTAMSTIMYEVLDFSTGLTDDKGRIITQGQGLTLFLGTFDFGVRSVIDKFGLANLLPGDIVMTNDPYSGGGTHLSDVSLIMPIYYEGHIIAFAINKGHWNEVGGKDAGSLTTDATEIYQEGLQFPCIKIFEAGQPVQGLIDLIRANVRTPDMSIGDMHAQAASLRIADKRLREMCEKNGLEAVQFSVESLLDYSEELTRQELAKIPRGVYEAVDFIDDDGVGNGPFEVRVKVTVTDAELICDFTGTHAQVPGPINCPRTGLYSGVRSTFVGLGRPGIPINEGTLRPLKIICPDGTLFTAQRPAPVSTYWETALYASDLIWKALAPALPERLPAGHFLSVCCVVLSGTHGETGEFILFVEPTAGGWGAGLYKDGENALVSLADGETYDVPVEVFETRYGLLVDEFALDTPAGAAGAGKYRGGRGLVRRYRATAPDTWVTGTFGRFKFPPWGMLGGQGGSRNYMEFLSADGRESKIVGKTARYHMKQGEAVRLVTGTGGGYGNPLERAVELVQDDVRNGYVSLLDAQEVYGVVLDEKSLDVLSLTRERAAA